MVVRVRPDRMADAGPEPLLTVIVIMAVMRMRLTGKQTVILAPEGEATDQDPAEISLIGLYLLMIPVNVAMSPAVV